MRAAQMISCCMALGLSGLGCGYGKDTGPTTPKADSQFEPLADRFVAKVRSCFDEVFQVNMGRPVTAEERAQKDRISKALGQLRAEVMGCLTGKGYGNEVQLDPPMVESWMAKAGCQEFAQAAFKAPQCIAIQSVVEEAGFTSDAPSPPRQPPVKKTH